MNINGLIDPYSLAYGAVTGFILGVGVYCIWNGHKVVKGWVEDDKNIPIPWIEDEDNPANWYLKNPNKFKVKNDG